MAQLKDNRDNEIKIILNKVEQLWRRHPEQRFGQLCNNYLGAGSFYNTDLETLMSLERGLNQDE